MPDTNHPRISEWVQYLARQIGKPDQDTFLVGHSMGCQAILRHLGTTDGRIGGILLIAGFVSIRKGAITDGNDIEMMDPWVKTAIDWQKARSNAGSSVLVLSDNDPYIDVSDADVFREKLGARIIIIPNAGHFTAKDGYTELHLALNGMLKMVK